MKNKRFWIGLIGCMIPYVIGILLYNQMPDTMAIHFNTQGVADGFASKNIALFGLPSIIVVVYLLCTWATEKDPKHANIPPIMMNLIYAICPVISIFTYFLMINASLEHGMDIFDTMSMTTLLVGVIFIVIGNYLPKCKQSYTVGIKTPWALEDNENWNKTHRMGGFLFMFAGIVCIMGGFISQEVFGYVLVPVLFAIIIIPYVYSYMLYKNKHGK